MRSGVKVRFEIVRSSDGKIAALGYFDYAMIGLQSGKAEPIPEWIIEKYSI
jgi:acyl-CoA thioesterase FadM